MTNEIQDPEIVTFGDETVKEKPAEPTRTALLIIEMPEKDAFWMREVIGLARMHREDGCPAVDLSDGFGHQRTVQIRIKEIVLQG